MGDHQGSPELLPRAEAVVQRALLDHSGGDLKWSVLEQRVQEHPDTPPPERSEPGSSLDVLM